MITTMVKSLVTIWCSITKRFTIRSICSLFKTWLEKRTIQGTNLFGPLKCQTSSLFRSLLYLAEFTYAWEDVYSGHDVIDRLL